MPEPRFEDGALLVETCAVGVCATDREILRGTAVDVPPGEEFLILGHESLGRVLEAPGSTSLRPGDLVVGMVRMPDPVPCAACARGEWDMCRNGLYTEHGIKQRHGFARERYRIDPSHVIEVPDRLGLAGVLVEPASIVAKAWEQIDRIGARTYFAPRRVLVTGAGTCGLLAALLGAQRNLDVVVYDRVTQGPRRALARALGAAYTTELEQALTPAPDVIVECTGAPEVVVRLLAAAAPCGVLCLSGLSSGRRRIALDAAHLDRELVLENNVVFGSVNANRRHYGQAIDALSRADLGWLQGFLTRRLALSDFDRALGGQDQEQFVKTILEPGEH